MSVQRYFAQRNNNVTQIVPERISSPPPSPTSITNCALYRLSISKAQFVGGSYYVDLSGLDTSGNAIYLDGEFRSYLNPSGPYIYIVSFVIDIDTPATAYPGLEFTLSFKNVPGVSGGRLQTIGIVSQDALDNDSSAPYILSPPFPPFLGGSSGSSSITLKSDGFNFDTVASGPSGWLGFPALSVIWAAGLPP